MPSAASSELKVSSSVRGHQTDSESGESLLISYSNDDGQIVSGVAEYCRLGVHSGYAPSISGQKLPQ